jgi:hypothetical protein
VAYRGQVTDSGYSGMFTFEGDWEKDLKDKSSIRPNLETLRDAPDRDSNASCVLLDLRPSRPGPGTTIGQAAHLLVMPSRDAPASANADTVRR